MPRVRQTDMILLRDIVSDVFACLGPLRACEEPVQRRIVEPVQELVFDPTIDYCIDPVRDALSVNPLACFPGCGDFPTLPQFDSPAEQDSRAAQVARAKQSYQYNYTLARTFREGKQGRGIAILDSVPLAQLPSMCWVVIVLQNALIVLDNLILVMEMLLNQTLADRAATVGADADRSNEDASDEDAGHDPDLVSVTSDYPREEIEAHRNELRALRANLFGTLVWGQTMSGHFRKEDDPPDTADGIDRPWRTPAPPHEQGAAQSTSSWCPCPRCSPEAIAREMVDDIKNALGWIVKRIMLLPVLDIRPYSIKAYDNLYQRIPLPQFALWFQNDEMFALQRIAGQNPVVIRRIEWNDWAERFPVTDEQFRVAMGAGDSLDDASKDGRLYLCDYKQSLQWGIPGDFPDFAGQKFINVPLALFALDKKDRSIIRAVAIQAGQEPSRTNPVITPDCGWNWEIAKSIVQNADCNDSEFYRHLGLGHLLTEAFILATYRQLPRQHPLYALLTPNFTGTLFTNNTAITSINVQGSYLNITEMIFSCTVDSTVGIAANAVADVIFNDNMLPKSLRLRGVDDRRILPNYPYRDDALLIWKAIHRWVDDYVRIYYSSDRDVTGDYELQAWVQEVSSPHGGRIRGVGDVADGRIETIEYLVDCMTEVIYTASAHHALTNFPLADFELYEPGWPGALYAPAPTEARGATRMQWLKYLSKLNIAVLQQALGFTIGSTYFTKLGSYPACHFTDIRVAAPLNAFQADLSEIEEVIREQNQTRVLPYPYLLPSRIPASTNI